MLKATSLATFVGAVEQVVTGWTPKGVDWYLQPWFRGHGDAEWSLEPGWYRLPKAGTGLGNEYYSEAVLLEKFKLRAPTYLDRLPATDWEWLFVMQHFGLPTRLLDWSAGALIALYFAVRDNTGRSDAAVWALNPWALNRETFGDYVLFPADDRRADEHAPRRPGLDAKLGALPLAITPIHVTARITAQRSVFTIHGMEQKALTRLARDRDGAKCLKRIIIPRNRVAAVRQELAISGITESLIFPDVGGLCQELKTLFLGL